MGFNKKKKKKKKILKKIKKKKKKKKKGGGGGGFLKTKASFPLSKIAYSFKYLILDDKHL